MYVCLFILLVYITYLLHIHTYIQAYVNILYEFYLVTCYSRLEGLVFRYLNNKEFSFCVYERVLFNIVRLHGLPHMCKQCMFSYACKYVCKVTFTIHKYDNFIFALFCFGK